MTPKKTSSPANTFYELSRYTWDKNRAIEASSEFFAPGETEPASLSAGRAGKTVKKRKVEQRPHDAEKPAAPKKAKQPKGEKAAVSKKGAASKKAKAAKAAKDSEPKKAAKPKAESKEKAPVAQESSGRKRVEARSPRPKRKAAAGSSSKASSQLGAGRESRFGMKGPLSRGEQKGASHAVEPRGRRKRRKDATPATGVPMGGAPAKKPGRARYVILAIVVLLVVFYAVDTVTQVGKIHRGVSVGTVKVGGMTVDEAARAIEANYNVALSSGDITMYADEAARQSGAEPTVISFDYDSLDSYKSNPPQGPVFQVSPATLGARIDGAALAEEAYHVGRGADFLPGRLKASTIGTKLDLKIEVQSGSLKALTSILTDSLGHSMVNPGIRFDGQEFTVTPGNDGYMVQADEFNKRIKEALLSGDGGFVIPMAEVRTEVKEKAAQDAAQQAQQALSEPVTLVYGDQTWSLDSTVLGPLVSTYVEKGSLVPYVSLPKVEKAIPELEGMGDIGQPAQDVKFSYDGESLTYVDATTGTGPDYEFITKRLNKIAFGNESLSEKAGETSDEIKDETEQTDTSANDAARRVEMTLTTSYPKLTLADAQELGLTDSLIASYTTEFDGASENKATNIKLLADLLTSTVIAPGQTFSINETAGECNAEKGFKEAGSILNGGITSEIGGGICQVATTIFNAVYEAGYPIVERHNHSNYMASYPDGLDASISWPYMDLKFKNDTDHYLLLLVDYTDSTVTCSLWGIDPGYETQIETIDWQEGEKATERTETSDEFPEGYSEVQSYGKDGHTTIIERKVLDAAGNLLREDTLESVYQPSATVTVVGTA